MARPCSVDQRAASSRSALLCAVAFIDFVDASIVNIALPSIRRTLHFSEQGLQWVPSAYLLTYGGFMLLGGRAADLIGRRRVLISGTVVIGISSLIGGLAGSSGVLIGARLAQGMGAAMMLPAALSILTTTFREGAERNTALGVWGGVGGLASAAGVLFGGLLTEGLGWRWVMFVNPVAVVFVLAGILRLIEPDRRRPQLRGFDVAGAVLASAGMLLLVYALVQAPTVGWGAARTIAEIAGGLVLLAAFVANERRHPNPLVPLVDLQDQRAGLRRRHPAGGVRGLHRDVLLPHPVHAERAALLPDPDRRRLSPPVLRDRHRRRRRPLSWWRGSGPGR